MQSPARFVVLFRPRSRSRGITETLHKLSHVTPPLIRSGCIRRPVKEHARRSTSSPVHSSGRSNFASSNLAGRFQVVNHPPTSLRRRATCLAVDNTTITQLSRAMQVLPTDPPCTRIRSPSHNAHPTLIVFIHRTQPPCTSTTYIAARGTPLPPPAIATRITQNLTRTPHAAPAIPSQATWPPWVRKCHPLIVPPPSPIPRSHTLPHRSILHTSKHSWPVQGLDNSLLDRSNPWTLLRHDVPNHGQSRRATSRRSKPSLPNYPPHTRGEVPPFFPACRDRLPSFAAHVTPAILCMEWHHS